MHVACNMHAARTRVRNAETMPSKQASSQASSHCIQSQPSALSVGCSSSPDLIVNLNSVPARDASGQAEAQVMSA